MDIGATPGLAVAVVREADVVYAKGFGFADRETGRRVTANTQFYIASTTKSFTALAGQLLAERGVIDLDMSLRQALPAAQFHPQVRADQITLRELLTHTHGIAMGGPVDFRAAYTGDQTNALQMALLKFHGPASTGKTYVYNNLGFNIFGLALDEQLKEGWKHVLQREIFEPLGMHLTTGWKSKADPNNLALPYELRASGHERVPYAKDDANMHAAGGLVSTAADLARYLIAHLNDGRLDGKQALPESAIRATHRQHARQDANSGSFHRFGAGLGWDLATYDGETVLQRFGGFPGFQSHLSVMPARRTGVVILSNAGNPSSRAADAIATYVFDLIGGTAGLASRSEEKLASLKVQTNVARERVAFDLDARRKRPQTTPLSLDGYAGTYESPALWPHGLDGRLTAASGCGWESPRATSRFSTARSTSSASSSREAARESRSTCRRARSGRWRCGT